MNERPDIEALRARLEGTRGREYWRSLAALSGTPEFKELLHPGLPQNASEWLDPAAPRESKEFPHREFPQNASEWLARVGRRGFLKLMSASLALAGVSACTRQPI